MKLSTIMYPMLEVKALAGHYSPDVLARYRQQIASTMPGYKTRHSLRVANHLAQVGSPKHVVDAGLFHDYPERGGDVTDLHGIGLHQQSHPLIQHMTNPDKADNDDPLEHLQQTLPGLDEETRNHLILVKCADRIDNLRRRVRGKRLTKSYLKASKKLLRWLTNNYTGSELTIGLLLLKLNRLGIKI